MDLKGRKSGEISSESKERREKDATHRDDVLEKGETNCSPAELCSFNPSKTGTLLDPARFPTIPAGTRGVNRSAPPPPSVRLDS